MGGRVTNNTYEFDAVATEINDTRDIISRTDIHQILQERNAASQRTRDIIRRLENVGWKEYAGKVSGEKAYTVFCVAPSCTLKAAKKYCKTHGVKAESLFEYSLDAKLCLITSGRITQTYYKDNVPQDCRFRDWTIVRPKRQVRKSVQQLTAQCCNELATREIVGTDDIDAAIKAHGLATAVRTTMKSRRLCVISRLHQRGFVTWNANEVYVFADATLSKKDVETFYTKKGLKTNGLRLVGDEKPEPPVAELTLSEAINLCVDTLDKQRIVNTHDVDSLLTKFGVEPTTGRHNRVIGALRKLGWQDRRSESTLGFCKGFYLVSPAATLNDVSTYCDTHDLSHKAYVCRTRTYTPPPPDEQTLAALRLQEYFLKWRDWVVSQRA